MFGGGCLCGAVRYTIEGKFGPVAYCHCHQCQRASGTAFAANAPVRTKYLTIATGEGLIREFESSPGKWRAFCSRCGSPLYSRLDADPEIRRIRLGTLDADPERRPFGHFWVDSKAPWHEIADDLPQYAKGSLEPEGDDT